MRRTPCARSIQVRAASLSAMRPISQSSRRRCWPDKAVKASRSSAESIVRASTRRQMPPASSRKPGEEAVAPAAHAEEQPPPRPQAVEVAGEEARLRAALFEMQAAGEKAARRIFPRRVEQFDPLDPRREAAEVNADRLDDPIGGHV